MAGSVKIDPAGLCLFVARNRSARGVLRLVRSFISLSVIFFGWVLSEPAFRNKSLIYMGLAGPMDRAVRPGCCPVIN
jgi:hypothetical protein